MLTFINLGCAGCIVAMAEGKPKFGGGGAAAERPKPLCAASPSLGGSGLHARCGARGCAHGRAHAHGRARYPPARPGLG